MAAVTGISAEQLSNNGSNNNKVTGIRFCAAPATYNSFSDLQEEGGGGGGEEPRMKNVLT